MRTTDQTKQQQAARHRRTNLCSIATHVSTSLTSLRYAYWTQVVNLALADHCFRPSRNYEQTYVQSLQASTIALNRCQHRQSSNYEPNLCTIVARKTIAVATANYLQSSNYEQTYVQLLLAQAIAFESCKQPAVQQL